jgi:hypothetical protein
MGRELSGFEAFCAGFQISGQNFNGEIASDDGIDVSGMPEVQEKWSKICGEQKVGMHPEIRAGLVNELAVFISEIKDANLLNSAWVKLYTTDGELLGQISPRHLLVALLDGLHMIDLHTENGSEPVDISDTDRLDFYIG